MNKKFTVKIPVKAYEVFYNIEANSEKEAIEKVQDYLYEKNDPSQVFFPTPEQLEKLGKDFRCEDDLEFYDYNDFSDKPIAGEGRF